MAAIADTAAAVATDLADSGVVVTARPQVVRQVKTRVDVPTIEHAAVREGFEAAGWAYDRHLYYHPDAAATAAADLAATLREDDGRLLVTHGEACDRLAEADGRRRVSGWEAGEFPALVADAFADRGWRVATVDGDRQYQFQLDAAITEEHPNGRAGRDPAELFADYVRGSAAALAEESQ